MNTQIRTAAQLALKEKRWTQDDLAREAGVRQATVSRLLAGQRGKGRGLEAVLAALGLKLVAVSVSADLRPLVEGEEKE